MKKSLAGHYFIDGDETCWGQVLAELSGGYCLVRFHDEGGSQILPYSKLRDYKFYNSEARLNIEINKINAKQELRKQEKEQQKLKELSENI